MKGDFLPHEIFHTRFAHAQTSHEVNNHLPHQCRKVLLLHNTVEKIKPSIKKHIDNKKIEENAILSQ